MTRVLSCAFVAATAFAVLLSVSMSHAQTIAGHDFDGNLSATTFAVFEGDFDAGSSTAHDDTFNGLYDFGTGSRFDRLGTVNPTVMDGASFEGSQEGLPFDMVDDSNNGFADDEFGILAGGVNDAAFAIVDTKNGSNIESSGLVSASWTFDVSAGSNMQISIDFAAIGDFEGVDNMDEDPDFMLFEYSIDGGATQTAFTVGVETDMAGEDAGVLYSVTMDDGDTFERYPSPFFDEAIWDNLQMNGPSGSLDYHPDDLDQDGFVDIDLLSGTQAIRALSSGGFNNTEFEAYKDPLIVNGDSSTGTVLNSQFQTVTVPIVGNGTELTLKMLGRADGSLEYTVFDNILIEEVSAGTPGDFDEDGDVDGNDYLVWQRTDGSALGLTEWQTNYGAGIGPGSALAAVPEPTTLALVGLAIGLISSRRNRS